jgi:hypothetical protein
LKTTCTLKTTARLVGLSLVLASARARADEAPRPTEQPSEQPSNQPSEQPSNVDADFERMNLLTKQLAQSQRAGRYASALSLGAGGALHLGVGLTFIATEGIGRLREPEQVFGVVQTAVGSLQLIGSVFPLLFVSDGERLREDLERDASEHPRDRAGVVARGEKRLFEAASGARTARLVSLIVNAVVLSAEVGIFVVNELQPDPSRGLRYGLGGAILASGAGTFMSVFPSELERCGDFWRSESGPSRAGWRSPRVGLAPLSGGGVASLSFSF